MNGWQKPEEEYVIELRNLREQLGELRVKYEERGAAMWKTGEQVRSLYAGSEVSKRILTLREERDRYKAALELIQDKQNLFVIGEIVSAALK